ncbi:GrpB family protein [Bacillus swezeyi]
MLRDVRRHLLFQEIFNVHPKRAEEYAKQKMRLTKMFPFIIKGYVDAE